MSTRFLLGACGISRRLAAASSLVSQRCGYARAALRRRACSSFRRGRLTLLALLVRRSPNAVSKADIHRELWPDTFVSDGNLAVLIAEIRRTPP